MAGKEKSMRLGEVVGAAIYDLRVQWPTYGRPLFRLVKFVHNLLCMSGVHALFVFRVGQLAHRLYLLPIAFVCRKLLYHWYHLDVWPGTEVGGGHWWCHPLGVVYTRHARFGRRVRVFQNVSVVSGTGGSPMVDDFVILYAGACVVGGVKVGRGAIIGAHAVVTRDVEPYAIVAGNPARVTRSRYLEEVDSEDATGLACCRPNPAVLSPDSHGLSNGERNINHESGIAEP
jgi:serine O-acetyltransferase